MAVRSAGSARLLAAAGSRSRTRLLTGSSLGGFGVRAQERIVVQSENKREHPAEVPVMAQALHNTCRAEAEHRLRVVGSHIVEPHGEVREMNLEVGATRLHECVASGHPEHRQPGRVDHEGVDLIGHAMDVVEDLPLDVRVKMLDPYADLGRELSTAALRSASDFTDPKSSGSRLPSADMFGPWIKAIRHERAPGPRSSVIVLLFLVRVVVGPNRMPRYTGVPHPVYLTIYIFDNMSQDPRTGVVATPADEPHLRVSVPPKP